MAQNVLVAKFGRVLGWNQVQVVMFGRTLEGVTEISYKDNKEMEAVMGAGPMPVGYGEGPYKAEFSITVLSEEYHALMASLAANTRVEDIPATDVSVLYQLNGRVVKDVIHNVKLLGGDKSVKQGDKSIPMKLPCFCTHIQWNVQ